jgi:hypothetical protein
MHTRLAIGRTCVRVAVSIVGAVVVFAGCGGHKDASQSETGALEPIAECKAYEDELRTCFHRETSFASQPDLLAKTDADRARVRALCADNIGRLKKACR